MKLKRDFAIPDEARLTLAAPAPASAERGRHIVDAVAKCSGCHGADLGGAVFEDDAAFGRYAGTNLTRGEGGIGARYQERDWVRAIRHGVAPDGRALVFMPSHELRHISEQDLADVIAYITALPPVNRTMPAPKVGPVARMLYLSGALPLVAAERIDHQAPTPAAPAAAETAEYGEYLSHVGDCFGCHGPKLDGANGMPGAANLTAAALGAWSEEDIIRALRVGRRPDGTALKTDMPWPYTAKLTDLELRATAKYLKSLPASTPQ